MSGNKKGKGGGEIKGAASDNGWEPVAVVYDVQQEDGYRSTTKYTIHEPRSEMVCTIVVPSPETNLGGEITRTANGATLLKGAIPKGKTVDLFNALEEWKAQNSPVKPGGVLFSEIDWKKLGKNRILAENIVTAPNGKESRRWELYPNVPANPIAAQCADQTPPSKGR